MKLLNKNLHLDLEINNYKKPRLLRGKSIILKL